VSKHLEAGLRPTYIFVHHDPSNIVTPATESITRALESLRHLGAVDGRSAISADGKIIERISVNVYSAGASMKSPEYRCSDMTLYVVAIMEASECGNTKWLLIASRRYSQRYKARCTLYKSVNCIQQGGDGCSNCFPRFKFFIKG